MNDLKAVRLETYKYAGIVAAIFEIGSLPFLGPDIKFSIGLAIGTLTAFLNFFILGKTSQKILEAGKANLTVMSYMLAYFVRLLIYGGAFLGCLKLGKMAALACALGFLTVQFALFFIHGFKTKFSTGRTVRPEVQEEFERMDQEREAHQGDRLMDKIKREIDYQEEKSDDIKK